MPAWLSSGTPKDKPRRLFFASTPFYRKTWGKRKDQFDPGVHDMKVADGMGPMLSRDRRERSGFGRLEDSHGITLLVNHIPNRRRHILPLPRPPRAPMPCPPLSSGFIQPHPVQAAARVGLKVIHDSLGASVRFHHDVNVISAHMGSKQAPVALGALLPHGGQHHLPAASVHAIRRLIHQLSLCGNPLRIGFDQTAPGQIMPSIDETRFIPVLRFWHLAETPTDLPLLCRAT